MAQPLTKGHLLVIDDEPPFCILIQRLLGREGFQVSVASSGEEAIRLFHSGLRVDAMLVDYRMPGLNGGQTLEALRQKGITAPAVLVSAAAEIHELATEHRFNGALAKPCSAEAIRAVLEPLLSRSDSANS